MTRVTDSCRYSFPVLRLGAFARYRVYWSDQFIFKGAAAEFMVSLYYICLAIAVQVKPGGGDVAATPDVDPGGPAAGGGGGGLFDGLNLFLPAMLMVMVLYFLFMLPRQQQKEQAQVSDMLDNLKKNDEVVTAGGIRGTVVNLRDGGEFLTIRIDENTNTKMKILKKSVIRVLSDDDNKSE